MNKRKVLFIRPSDCTYCKNGYYGLGHTVNYAATKSFNVEDLKGIQADNPYIDMAISNNNPFLIYGSGHGNINVYTANSETPVWITGENLSHLSGKVIYLLSCLTANQLGPYIIDQGALSYGGFLISWTWLTNNTEIDPYEDEYAEGFYKSTNKFFETLLDGLTMSEAMKASIDEYNYWIDKWSKSEDPNAGDAIKWLIHDRDGLVIFGDTNAKVSKCNEITDKTSCIDMGCWWYDDECHCDAPSIIANTYDFEVRIKE